MLRFRLVDGLEGRTIVSGIAKYYEPEELIGKNLVFIANFPPRKLMGIESQGMILSAVDYKTERLQVMIVSDDIAPGSRLG